jgi:hypothetical protein
MEFSINLLLRKHSVKVYKNKKDDWEIKLLDNRRRNRTVAAYCSRKLHRCLTSGFVHVVKQGMRIKDWMKADEEAMCNLTNRPS